MNLFWVKIGALALVVGGAFYAGWSWRASRCEVVRQTEINTAVMAALKEHTDKQTKADAIGSGLAKELETQRANNRSLTQRLNDEIAKSRTYSDCIVDPDSVRIINEAVAARGGASTVERETTLP